MTQTTWKLRGLGLLGVALLWLFAGCATVGNEFDKLVDHLPDKVTFWSNYYYHTVRYNGETLLIISEWYTGDRENWWALAKANPELNPKHISIGAKIRVPNKLLRNHKPMPKHFVEAVQRRQAARKALLAKVMVAPQAEPVRPRPTCHIHKVRYQGETLSLIAKWYTGDVENWRALTKVNPQIDPNRIVIGAKIRIPRKLLNTRKRMPHNFIASTKPRGEPKPSPSAFVKAETSDDATTPPTGSPPPEVKVEELELFGPK